MFKVGDKCTDILVVLSGTISIELSDGDTTYPIDIIGKGSVIGGNNVITGERWIYRAKVRSFNALIFKIEYDIIVKEMNFSSLLYDHI